MLLLTAALSLFLGIALAVVLVCVVINLVVRGARPQWTLAAVGRIYREWAASVLMMPVLLTGVLKSPGPRPSSCEGPGTPCPPVLLVHGYDMNRRCWALLATWLRRRGWRWVWAVNHQPARAELPQLAAQLGVRIQALKAVTGADQIDVVAHSMGGVVAAWYAAKLDGAQHIRRLVTIGTPWQGTRMAVLGMRPEARGLQPDSPVIAEICPPAVPVASIWSPEDQIIAPSDSSAIAEAQLVELDQGGHLEMLLDPRVWRRVGALLAAPDDPRPGAALPPWPPQESP